MEDTLAPSIYIYIGLVGSTSWLGDSYQGHSLLWLGLSRVLGEVTLCSLQILLF